MIKIIFTAPIGMGLRDTLVKPLIASMGHVRVAVVGSAIERCEWLYDLDGDRAEKTMLTFNRFYRHGAGFKYPNLTVDDLIVVDELQEWQLNKILPVLKETPAQVWLINPPVKFLMDSGVSFQHVALNAFIAKPMEALV